MNRLEKICRIRKSLAEDRASIGSWIQIPHPSIAELMGAAGYDWIAVDLEHGSASTHQLPDLFRAIELNGTLPLARIAQGDAKECKRALDAGAGGIIVPMVRSANQLSYIRDHCRWPPAGKRGVGFSRANLFGQRFDAYISEAQAPLLIAMIEDIKAIEKLPRILQVDGLDAIIAGPYDLSASLGVTGEFHAPEFEAAMSRLTELCREYGIPCGLHVVNPEPAELQQRIIEGYRFIAYGIDAVFIAKSSARPHNI